ncbi:nitrate/nitrite transporter NrtS [Paramagnetospirillum magneticum]|nr:nitrate/nitrite transporter NrtS [Paramagnetospirillum magneticum]
MPGSLIRRFIQAATSDGLQRRSLTLTAIVGTLLNLINQGDSLLSGHTPNLFKLALTYAVPYCVATIAGATALMRRR